MGAGSEAGIWGRTDKPGDNSDIIQLTVVRYSIILLYYPLRVAMSTPLWADSEAGTWGRTNKPGIFHTSIIILVRDVVLY
jgi:hypothetical protein